MLNYLSEKKKGHTPLMSIQLCCGITGIGYIAQPFGCYIYMIAYNNHNKKGVLYP